MHCIKQNADQLYRVRRGNDQPFTLVVRRSPEGYELGEGKGEHLNPEELHKLSVTIYEPNFGEGFTPDIRTFGDALGFELTREHTERCGLGIYEVEVSFTIDGEEGRTLRAPLCLVVKEGAHVTAQNHQLILDLAPIAKGDRGDRGQSAYEAYLDNTDDHPKLTEGEWIASLLSAADKLLEAKGYTDSKVGELSTEASSARESLRASLTESIASGINTAVSTANGYADTKFDVAKGYADTVLDLAKGYSDTQLGIAKGYSDTNLGLAKGYADNGDAATLRGANNYTDLHVKRARDETRQEIEEAKRWNLHTHTFDLSALDPSKYYAAVIQLPTQGNINQPDRYSIVIYAGLDRSIPKPPYATHSMGFSAELRWSVSAQGNGARYEGRVVESYGTASVKAGEQVMSQPYHSAVLRSEYVYLRGGFVYQCRVTSDFAPTFTLAVTDFSVDGRNAVITSPVDSVTPPKSDTDRLRDSIDEGDRATLAGAKAYADGHLARGRSEMHDEVNILKTQLAGKMQHFIGAVVPTGYRKGDLWTLTADWTSFKAGSVLVADADELAGRYTPRHWQELWGFRREAKEAVRDLQLGGVQLLRSPWSTQEREQDGGAHLVRFGYELPAGTYTLSGDMEVKRKGNGMRIIPTPFKEYFEGHRDEWGILLAFPEGGRFEMTFTAKRSFDGFYLYPSQAWTSPGDPKAGHVVFRRLKIERGNKATDWSPAPEDTELLIDERVKAAKAELLSEMSQQREALEARIAALEAKASGG